MTNLAVPIQIAYVARDFQAMEDALARQFGVKKWFRNYNWATDPSRTQWMGKPASFVVNQSLTYVGDLQLEVIAPVSGDDNPYEEFLRTSGPGLHHLCIEVEDLDKAVRDYASEGVEAVFSLDIPGMGRYGYVRAPGSGSALLELAQISAEFKKHFEAMKAECR